MLKIYNTLTNQKEEFRPIDPKSIGIYVCGMTVYDFCHMGHARVLVMFDVITRHMKRNFSDVNYVRNITDIDDKIISRAIENNEDIYALTNRFIDAMHEDEKALGVLTPDLEPRATDSIDQMINMIESLTKKGLAYQGKNGDVYYSVRKFKNYGRLSGKNLDDLVAGARIDIESDKQDPLDFVLWKMAKPNEPKWPSPWGEGRPGWHIECSAMSTHFIENHFDIHGGGMDLTFPHHENEIAQTCSAHNSSHDLKSFAKYWFHNGFVNVEGEKMSKSLGNIRLVNELVKEFKGEVLRLTLVSAHYRQPLNWTRNIIKQNSTMLDRFYRNLKDLENIDAYKDDNQIDDNIIKGLYDDLNTPKVIAALNVLSNQIGSADKKMKGKIKYNLLEVGKIIGILQNSPDKWLGYGKSAKLDETTIERLIKDRNEARGNKNFEVADQIRNELKEKGIEIEDTSDGTVWRSN